MAITDPNLAGPGFADNHLDPAALDALIDRSGTTATLRIATRCGCYDVRTGAPDPACMLCMPFGVIWDDPVPTKVFGPNRKPTRRQDAAGNFDASDAFFTFKTGILPPRGSRVTLPLSQLVVDDMLVKGERDVIRYPNVVAVEAAFYMGRDQPEGSEYNVVKHDLTFTGSTPHLTFAGRQVTWAVGSAVPDGTVYRVRFKALVEYLVWEDQDRNEGGNALPGKCLCKRVDYLLHPRDEKAASY